MARFRQSARDLRRPTKPASSLRPPRRRAPALDREGAVDDSNPIRLLVDVVPALDLAGKPWRVLLLESHDGKVELVSDEPAPATRALALPMLEGRSYILRLRSSENDVWMTDPEPFVAGKALPREPSNRRPSASVAS